MNSGPPGCDRLRNATRSAPWQLAQTSLNTLKPRWSWARSNVPNGPENDQVNCGGFGPASAACAAVWIHGNAGDYAALGHTQAAMRASDVAAALPDAFRYVSLR